MSTEKQNTETHISSTGQNFTSSDWLDAHFLWMQPEYEEMLRWVGLQPSWHVLDAACGAGSFLPLMTELVGKGGRVSALDLAPENVQIVEQRARQSQWPASVDARVGNILALPYADHSFDAVWCANTTQYLSDEELHTMLAEFRRVVRPSGLIAIKEYDITTQQFQPLSPRLFPHFQQARFRAGDAYAHQLYRAIDLARWLRAAGLLDIRQKPTLMVRFQPLPSFALAFAGNFLKACYLVAQNLDLPAEEIATWAQLADSDAPDHIVHDPDFQYRAIQTVFVGTTPGLS